MYSGTPPNRTSSKLDIHPKRGVVDIDLYTTVSGYRSLYRLDLVILTYIGLSYVMNRRAVLNYAQIMNTYHRMISTTQLISYYFLTKHRLLSE